MIPPLPNSCLKNVPPPPEKAIIFSCDTDFFIFLFNISFFFLSFVVCVILQCTKTPLSIFMAKS